MNLNNLTSALPSNVQSVVNPLLQTKVGNIKIDFSKVKFPQTPEQWKALGEKIKQDLKKMGKNITLQDAIDMARRIAAKIPQQGGATQTPATQTTTPVKVQTAQTAQTAQTEKEVSSFIDKVMNDKRYWFGILILLLLLRKK